jgi:hypothetical protein
MLVIWQERAITNVSIRKEKLSQRIRVRRQYYFLLGLWFFLSMGLFIGLPLVCRFHLADCDEDVRNAFVFSGLALVVLSALFLFLSLQFYDSASGWRRDDEPGLKFHMASIASHSSLMGTSAALIGVSLLISLFGLFTGGVTTFVAISVVVAMTEIERNLSDVAQLRKEIRNLANELYEKGEAGGPVDHWVKAERLILEQEDPMTKNTTGLAVVVRNLGETARKMHRLERFTLVATLVQLPLVLLSVLYIGSQLKQQKADSESQTKLAQARNVEELAIIASSLDLHLAHEQDIVKRWEKDRKWTDDEALDHRHRLMMSAFLVFYENMYRQHQEHLLDDRTYRFWECDFVSFVHDNLVDEYWNEVKGYYLNDFAADVDQLLKQRQDCHSVDVAAIGSGVLTK